MIGERKEKEEEVLLHVIRIHFEQEIMNLGTRLKSTFSKKE
jgi:hypothetical protein